MAKPKKPSNSSKKKPIEQYAHKGKQRVLPDDSDVSTDQRRTGRFEIPNCDTKKPAAVYTELSYVFTDMT
jgi:hypothetical protein